MFQLSSVPPTSGPASIRATPSGIRDSGGFSLALTSLLLPGGEGEAPPGPLPDGTDQEAPARQLIAGTGKDLPEGEGEAAHPDADSDKDEDGAEAPFAWFGMTPVVPESAPATIRFGLPTPAATLPEGEAAPAMPQIELPAAALCEGVEAAPAVTGETFALDVQPEPALEAPAAPALPRQIEGVEMTRPGRAELPARIELPARELLAQSLAAMNPATQPGAETQPPAAALAAPLAAAGIPLPESFRRFNPSDPASNPLAAPTGATEVLRPHVVQAVAEMQQPSIDTRRAEWMTQTIERIEALRDSPNSRETSIRLSPDALGTVDVSIRHEGDRVHVRFSADNPQARALLAEAQPRLTEIAEARGLRLGQTSVDAGTAGNWAGQNGQSQRQDAASRPQIASAPAGVSGGETESRADDRVA